MSSRRWLKAMARPGQAGMMAIVILLTAGVAAMALARSTGSAPKEYSGKNLRVDHVSAVQAAIDAKCRGGGVVQLSGTYRTVATVLIDGCHGLTVKGPATLDGSAVPRDRADRHVSIRGSSNVLIEDVTVLGGRCGQPPCPGDESLSYNERQHGFEIAASDHVELRRVVAANVWGDAVYVTAKTFEGETPSRVPANIVVRDSYFVNTGRQGIAASAARGMLIERTVVRRAGRYVFDFEAESGGVADLTVRDSDVVRPGNGTLNVSCTQGTSSMLNRGPFILEGNRIYGGTLKVNPFNCELPAGVVRLTANRDSLAIQQAPQHPPVLAQIAVP